MDDSSSSIRLLWRHADGRAALWSLDSTTGTQVSGSPVVFGPFAAWSARSVGVSASGKPWLLWDRLDGRAQLWGLSPAGAKQSATTFGPY